MKVADFVADYDWQQAVGYAPFKLEDISRILYSVEGQNDGDEWVAIVHLKDGRFGYVKAGCDYTGWDCHAGGAGDTRNTLEEIIREVCEEDDRKRLGLKL